MIQSRNRDFYPRWCTEEDGLLLRLHDEGVPRVEIARQLGRSEEAVRIHLGKLTGPGKRGPRRSVGSHRSVDDSEEEGTPAELYTRLITGCKSPRYLKCLIHTKKK